MTATETPIAALPRPQRFHDRHEERTYLRAVETARRILDDPSLIAKGAIHLERFMSPDPRQAACYLLWREVLADGAERLVRRLLADSDEGRALRESSPVFVTFTPEELRALWSATPA